MLLIIIIEIKMCALILLGRQLIGKQGLNFKMCVLCIHIFVSKRQHAIVVVFTGVYAMLLCAKPSRAVLCSALPNSTYLINLLLLFFSLSLLLRLLFFPCFFYSLLFVHVCVHLFFNNHIHHHHDHHH